MIHVTTKDFEVGDAIRDRVTNAEGAVTKIGRLYVYLGNLRLIPERVILIMPISLEG